MRNRRKSDDILRNRRSKNSNRKKLFHDSNSVASKIERWEKARDEKIIASHTFELEAFLEEVSSNKNIVPKDYITIPQHFSLELNYNETIDALSLIRKSIFQDYGELRIDFQKCETVDFSALFLFKVIAEEYIKNIKDLSRKLRRTKAINNVKIRASNESQVNLKLIANEIIDDVNLDKKGSDLVPTFSTNLIRGNKKQQRFDENRKGKAATKIRHLINTGGLAKMGMKLSESGESHLDGLISEVLSNAEDHGLLNTWYAFGNSFESNLEQDSEKIAEINIGILNFGNSIYQGILSTREENVEVYSQIQSICREILRDKKSSGFTEDNLFTLTALQDGISRLKYESPSRGTGTMKFISSFLELGDYQNLDKSFMPRLMLFTGETFVLTDNQYPPVRIDNLNFLPLNSEENILAPPSKTHLKKLSRFFPGTLLVAKVYLNKKHLTSKISKNGN